MADDTKPDAVPVARGADLCTFLSTLRAYPSLGVPVVPASLAVTDSSVLAYDGSTGRGAALDPSRLQRLGIRGSLKTTLASTNPCESMIECVRRTSRNVKRWQSGEMALRWTAAGMLEAERQFRRIIGYRDLAKLAVAIERDLAHTTPVASPTEEAGAARRRALVVPLARVTGEEVIEAV